MTKSAKLDALTISLDSGNPAMPAVAPRQPDGPDSARADEIESDLVAELESALQAVLHGVSQPDEAPSSTQHAAERETPSYGAPLAGERGAQTSRHEAPSFGAPGFRSEASETGRHESPPFGAPLFRKPATAVRQAETSESRLPIFKADTPQPGRAAQGIQAPYSRLQPAQPQRSPRALSWEIETASDHDRPAGHRAPRRLAPRAAACVAALLGVAATGAVALTSLAGSDDPRPGSAAENASASEAPTAVAAQADSSEPVQLREELAAAPPAEPDVPMPAVAQEEASGAVTLLRPVGNGDNAETGVAAAAPSPVSVAQARQVEAGQTGSPVAESWGSRFGEEPAEQAEVAQEMKVPDRLIEIPAPAGQPHQEAEAGAQVGVNPEQLAQNPLLAPADQPVSASEAVSPFEPALPEAATPPPSPGELVAAAEPRSGEAGPEELTAGQEDAEQMQTAGAAAAPQQPVENARSAAIRSAVNMRAGPDNGAAVLTIVPAGSQVKVIDCDYWCEVVFAGERGWIYKSFVSGADS